MFLYVLVCMNFREEILLRGEGGGGGGGGGKNVKPEKIRNFQKWKNDNNNNKLS